MVSTLLRIVPEWVARRSGRAIVRALAPATERYVWSVESQRHDPRRVALAFSVDSLNVDEDATDVSCALRSKADKWARRRAPEKGHCSNAGWLSAV